MQLIDLDFTPAVAPAAPATPRWDSKKTPGGGARNAEPILDPVILDPAHDPVPALTSALHKHARLLRQRLDGHPDVAAQQAGEKLAKGVVSAVMHAMEVVNAELGDVMRVGLVVSAGRPGLKKMGLTLTGRPDSRRRVECSLGTALSNDELVLSAECLGRIAEVARVKLSQPDAPERLKATVESYLLEAAERFANGAGQTPTPLPAH